MEGNLYDMLSSVENSDEWLVLAKFDDGFNENSDAVCIKKNEHGYYYEDDFQGYYYICNGEHINHFLSGWVDEYGEMDGWFEEFTEPIFEEIYNDEMYA